MPLLDSLKDSVVRVFPKKKEEPVDTAHLGYGNSLRPFDEDVCHLPFQDFASAAHMSIGR